MRFTDRWARLNKRKFQAWATTDNDIHNNSGYIWKMGTLGFCVSVSRLFNGYRLSMTTENFYHPETLDEAKALAEQFIETLYKLED